jgi:hypothetical protein
MIEARPDSQYEIAPVALAIHRPTRPIEAVFVAYL